MNPTDVVGKVLSPDSNKAIIKVSTEAAEQEGMFNICKGLTLAFQGPLHHTLKDHMTRPEALKFCGFVDTLLGVFAGPPRRTEDRSVHRYPVRSLMSPRIVRRSSVGG